MTDTVRLKADTTDIHCATNVRGVRLSASDPAVSIGSRTRPSRRATRTGWQPDRVAAVALLCGLFTLMPALQPRVDAQLPAAADDRFAGLQWRFVRIKYHHKFESGRVQQDFYGEPWGIDAPAAEQNLSRRVKTATAIQVEDAILLTLDDPRLFEYPWIYFVEPSSMRLQEKEIPILREFFARGGFAMMDDFHGPAEWADLEQQMKLLFPDRQIIEVPKDHPVFSCFYKMDGFPQVPGLGSFLAGRTWEKGGVTQHLRTILDDTGRPMVFINFNTDMGDGWEWSNAQDYPGYIKYTAMAYRMGINEIVYALTH
jgi:Domain of unknown function (DUF4159)